MDCPVCGLPVKEGERFCNACGSKLPHIVKQSFCPICGNTLLEGAKACSLCGTPVAGNEETTAAEVIAQQKEAMKNPSMDELYVPVITDEMLGIKNEPVVKNDFPTMDAVTMPGQKPRPQPQQQQQKVSHRNDPLPMPSTVSATGASVNNNIPTPTNTVPMPTNTGSVNVPNTPTVAQTPTVNDTMYQQPQQNMYQQPQQNMYQQNPNQQVESVITPEGNRIPQQPNYGQAPQPNYGQQPAANQPQKAKGGLSMVQILLIVAIIAVILIDVFVVFRGKIFGSDKNKDAEKNISIVTIDDLE